MIITSLVSMFDCEMSGPLFFSTNEGYKSPFRYSTIALTHYYSAAATRDTFVTRVFIMFITDKQ